MLLDSLLAESNPHPGRLRALDVSFAHFLGTLDIQADPTVLLLGALVSRQVADGHLCLDLSALVELADQHDWSPVWRQSLLGVAHDEWRHRLLSSPLISNAGSDKPASPLVLDGLRLYLRRYWNHEQFIATTLRQRLANPLALPAHLGDELTRLFPPTAANTPNWPRIACALAARGAFTVITGGPGTGKTTTVVRLLGLLQTLQLSEQPRPLRIRLAAPTGKAAARLNASIAAQLAQLQVDDNVRATIPAEVDTLHRLLGARPDTRRFRHHAGNPLHLDVLVIDEASMIDLELMSAVLAALPAQARLILLGDKDQLSSVEAGAVLGDLCRNAETGHYSKATAIWLRDLTGDDISAWIDEISPDLNQPDLNQHVAMLRHSHRFGAGSGIGQLARAVNAGDLAQVQALLRNPPPDIAWTDTNADARQLSALVLNNHGERRGYRHYLEQLRLMRPASQADNTAYVTWARQVLADFNRFQLLCALRQGPYGTEGLNRQIAEILQQAGLIETSHGWYEGRPVLITRNDYNLGLMNGDIGIALRIPDDDGELRLRVAFHVATGTDSDIRFVLPSRLSELDSVYAMTVHKSQGSEFEHSALILPAEPHGVLSRELLYTGITRARRWFSLVGRQEVIELATSRLTRRHSGLADRL
ncbi:exodeoxyribonuclease V subunit alpha [Dyella tabacisoli]|uniref:RecBCD enzyme subunit RecD n=1 Tax=Dyella tabacisoli TaxID=2282381 RepID=A0A369UIL0_9GAMM|nr:exodeoxyribonuclease V subunit alpha [Dyella tabacisoli]RDD79945.1 exodeoxyribonuclease V subunit alpha [Dyella tabacisoli]